MESEREFLTRMHDVLKATSVYSACDTIGQRAEIKEEQEATLIFLFEEIEDRLEELPEEKVEQ